MKKEHAQTMLIIGVGLLSTVVACAATSKVKNTNEINNLNDIISQYGTVGSLGQNLISVDNSTLPQGSFPLTIGDKNKYIYNLQIAINKKYGANLQVTGQFDAATADELCSNYFDTCFNWYPETFKASYTVSQTDYDAILS